MRMQRPCHAAGVAANRQWFCPFLFLNLFLHVSQCLHTHTHTHTSTYMQYKPRVPGTSNGTRPSSSPFLCQRYANFHEMWRFLSRYGSGVDAGALRFGNGVDSSMLFSMGPVPLRPLPPSVPQRSVWIQPDIATDRFTSLSSQPQVNSDWVPRSPWVVTECLTRLTQSYSAGFR